MLCYGTTGRGVVEEKRGPKEEYVREGLVGGHDKWMIVLKWLPSLPQMVLMGFSLKSW